MPESLAADDEVPGQGRPVGGTPQCLKMDDITPHPLNLYLRYAEYLHACAHWVAQPSSLQVPFVELDSAISSAIFPFTTSKILSFSLPHLYIDKQLLFSSPEGAAIPIRRQPKPRATVLASALVLPLAFVIPLSSYPPPCSERRRLGRLTKSSVSIILRTCGRSIAEDSERGRCFLSLSFSFFFFFAVSPLPLCAC